MIKLKPMVENKITFGNEEDMSDGQIAITGINFGGKGGGGSSVVEKPVFVPPPAAPAVSEAATQEDAVTPEEEMTRKKEALKSGTKSLQIPMTTGGEATGQVGTGSNKPKV